MMRCFKADLEGVRSKYAAKRAGPGWSAPPTVLFTFLKLVADIAPEPTVTYMPGSKHRYGIIAVSLV